MTEKLLLIAHRVGGVGDSWGYLWDAVSVMCDCDET